MPSRDKTELQKKPKGILKTRIHKMKTRSRLDKSVNFNPLDPKNTRRLKAVRKKLREANFYSTEKFKEEESQGRILWRQQLEQHKLKSAPTNNPGVLNQLYTSVKSFFGY